VGRRCCQSGLGEAGTSNSSNQHEITSTNTNVVEIDFTNAVNAVTNVMFRMGSTNGGEQRTVSTPT
jgi:hypothetical protein